MQRGSAARFRPLLGFVGRRRGIEPGRRARRPAPGGHEGGRWGAAVASRYRRVSPEDVADESPRAGSCRGVRRRSSSADFGSGPVTDTLPCVSGRQDLVAALESSVTRSALAEAGWLPGVAVGGAQRGSGSGSISARHWRAVSSAGERFPDTEEVTGSNPVRPTSTNAVLRPSFPYLVRHRCVTTPRPRLHNLVVSVRSEVGVPLGCPVALVAEQRLDVVQRHAVDHQPARGGVAHDPGREAADARGLTAGYQIRSRKFPSSTGPPSGAVNTRASRGRPVISADMPSRM